MTDQNTNVELTLSGKNEKLINSLKQGEQQIKAFGDKTSATFKRAGESMTMFSNKIVTGMASIGVGYGFVEMTKDMMEFDGTLRRIGRTSDLSAEDVQGLRKSIIGLISPNAQIKIPLTKGEYANMALELNAAGIQLNVIKDLLPQVGKGAVAAGIDSKIYSQTIGDLLTKYKVLVTDLPAMQEQLNAAMKFEHVRENPTAFLQTLSGMSKTMQLIGVRGKENITPLLALNAVLTSHSANAEEAQGSVEALMTGIFRLARNRRVLGELKTHGVEFFNKGGSMKNIAEILPQIKNLLDAANKAGVSMNQVAMNMGRPEAGKALEVIAENYDEIMKKVETLKASQGSLDKGFQTEADAMSNKLKTFQNQLDAFKVDHMSTALKYLTILLDQLNAHPMIAKGIIGGLIGVGGLVLLQKSISAIGGLIGLGRDIGKIWTGKGAKGTTGGIAGALTGGQRVFVTNWPIGFGGYSGNVPGSPASGRMSKGMGLLGKGSMLAGAGIAGYEIGSLLNEGMAAIADKLSGGKYKNEGWLGDMLYDFLHKAENPNVKNDIKLNINIDKDGRVTADNGSRNTDLKIDLDRGMDFGVPSLGYGP